MCPSIRRRHHPSLQCGRCQPRHKASESKCCKFRIGNSNFKKNWEMAVPCTADCRGLTSRLDDNTANDISSAFPEMHSLRKSFLRSSIISRFSQLNDVLSIIANVISPQTLDKERKIQSISRYSIFTFFEDASEMNSKSALENAI